MDTRTLEPPPYLRQLADCLAEQEPALWARLGGIERRAAAEAEARLALLRDATEWEPGAGEPLERRARAAAAALDLDLPVVLYRGVASVGSGARLCWLPGAAHIVLDPAAGQMEEPVALAVIGRELARYGLWTVDDGRYWALEGLASELDRRLQVEGAHARTVERARTFQELHCDRGGALAAGSMEALRGLLEWTGAGAEGPRLEALELWWSEGTGAERGVTGMVRGSLDLDTLDYVDQVQLAGLTRRWLSLALEPAWMQTESVLGHCRQMFPGFAGGPMPGDEGVVASLVLAEVRSTLPDLQPYWLSLLLDLGVVDEALGDAALVRSFEVAEEVGLRAELVTLAREELGLGAQLLADLWRDRASLLAAKEQG